MTTLSNSLEGIASGTTLTAGSGGNTGPGGNYFDTIVTPTSSGSVVAQSGAAKHGSIGCRFTVGTVAGSGHCDWTQQGTLTEVWYRVYCKLPSGFSGSGSGGGGMFRVMSGGALGARVDFGSNSSLVIRDASSTIQATSSE